MKNYAERARPLSDLTRKNVIYTWGADQEMAFRDLQEALIEEPVLKLYNPRASETVLYSDASSEGLSGILTQKQESDGQLHPVYYVSKKTTDAEKRYHSSKLELMAVVYCVERLRNFLIGLKFVVYTDCQALIYLNSQKTQNAQIARWFSLLAEYDLELKFRPGKMMQHVDSLSRAATSEATDTLSEIYERLEVLQTMNQEDYILMIQMSDEQLRKLIEVLKVPQYERSVRENHLVNNYKLENGRLLRETMVKGQKRSIL